MNAVGMDDMTISTSAGAAALAKKASDEADHIAVAKVLKPSGPRMRVTGNSFIVTRNASAAPTRTPGHSKGTVTLSIAR
jgi:hypothetical protein